LKRLEFMTTTKLVHAMPMHELRFDWTDVEALSRSVQEAKERHYNQLTSGGIAAFPGRRGSAFSAC
jgi:hypothetical protein